MRGLFRNHSFRRGAAETRRNTRHYEIINGSRGVYFDPEITRLIYIFSRNCQWEILV